MPNYNQIRDFYLAAYLITAGIKLQSHEKTAGGTLFNFTDDSRTNDAMSEYYSLSAAVEPLSFSNSIKALKTIVHSYDLTTKSKSEGNNYNVKQYRSSK
jgi:Domain of unknown function (DUF5659)